MLNILKIIYRNKTKLKLNLFSLLVVFLSISCINNKLPDFVTGLNDTIEKEPVNNSNILKKVKFLPNWTVDSQFAAYFVGKELGIYKKYGIEIEILNYNPYKKFSEEFTKNNVDFAVLWLSNALEAINENTEIVNIAQFSNKSSVMFVTKKKDKMSKIQDFNGKKVAVWYDFQIQAKSFFQKNKIKLEVIPVVNSLNLFYCDGVDIINANYFDEYHNILSSGFDSADLNVFFMADYGVNLLEDGLYCKKSLINTDPMLCVNFTNATLESWNYVFAHKDESIAIIEKVMKANNRPFNKAHQKWMLDRFEEIYSVKGTIRTHLSKIDYINNTNVLMDEKVIEKVKPYEEFFQYYINLENNKTKK